MYIVFQYLFALLFRAGTYMGFILGRAIFLGGLLFGWIMARKPRFVLVMIVLLISGWAIFVPKISLGQFAFDFIGRDKTTAIKERSLSEGKFISPYRSYVAANFSAVFSSPSILAVQAESADEQEGLIEEENLLASLHENALLVQTAPITFVSQDSRSEVITYVVQSGDTSSSIAASFGITTNTLLWANKLDEGSIIRPGDELAILPTTGVLHKVKNGETVGWMASHYKADAEKIIAFNDLPADGSIVVGDKLVIPDGLLPPPPRPKTYATKTVAKSYAGPGTGKSRAFPWGQCTYYVAQKRIVPWSGHAKSWLANANALGYSVCWGRDCQPEAGAIISMSGSSWLIRLYGHVAYVEAVSGDWVTISEMNYAGLGVKTVRTINKNSSLIRGYIY